MRRRAATRPCCVRAELDLLKTYKVRNPTTSWSELRVRAQFNPIGLFQRDAALLLHSHGVRNVRTVLHNREKVKDYSIKILNVINVSLNK